MERTNQVNATVATKYLDGILMLLINEKVYDLGIIDVDLRNKMQASLSRNVK